MVSIRSARRMRMTSPHIGHSLVMIDPIIGSSVRRLHTALQAAPRP
jgi:hypothetical protein